MLTGEFGKYRIENVIGMGGVSIVYRAQDRSLNREVALKILNMKRSINPEEVRRFQREVKIAQRLRHPNIIDIYEHGEVESFVYLAMEYMPGGSLGERYANPIPETLGDSAKRLRVIAGALDFAHSQGVLHRDLKLSNILVGANDRLVLSDFGLALMPDSSRITQSGQTFGTPIYMSPEQVQGTRTVNYRTDIYSLAVMAYLLATGYYPFLAGNSLMIMNRHLTENAPLPSKLNPRLPEEMDLVLLKGLAKRPDDRYDSAGALALAFEEAVAPISSTEIIILSTQPTPMVEPSKYFATAPVNGQESSPTHPVNAWQGEYTPDLSDLNHRYGVNVNPARRESTRGSFARWLGALVLALAMILLLIGLSSILPNQRLDTSETLVPEIGDGENTATATATSTPTFTMTNTPSATMTRTALPTNTRRPSATVTRTLTNFQQTATLRAEQTAAASGTALMLIQATETNDVVPTRTRIMRTAVSTAQGQPTSVATGQMPTSVFPATSVPATNVPATNMPAPTSVPPTSVPPTSVPPTSVPPTAIPPSPVPPTPIPPTPVPPTSVPPTPVPPTNTPVIQLPLPTIPLVQTLLPGLIG